MHMMRHLWKILSRLRGAFRQPACRHERVGTGLGFGHGGLKGGLSPPTRGNLHRHSVGRAAKGQSLVSAMA